MNRFLSGFAMVMVALGACSASAHPIATFNTVAGTFQVELFEDVAPGTVENFLNYVLDGDYNQSFIHRSAASPAVIQGGGFFLTGEPPSLASIPTDPEIMNEFQLSNVRGTIAMAKTEDPNSATSQWFINVGDNSTALDNPLNSGGFTVFGQVIGGGMTVVDAIAALQVLNAGRTFTQLPVWNYTSGDIMLDNLVVVSSITTPPPWQNMSNTLDVSADGNLTAQDVGLIINEFNARGFRRLPSLFALTGGEDWFFDTSGDNNLTPQDAGRVINELNALAGGSGAAAQTASTGSFDVDLISAGTPGVAGGQATSVPEPSSWTLSFGALISLLVAALQRTSPTRKRGNLFVLPRWRFGLMRVASHSSYDAVRSVTRGLMRPNGARPSSM